MKLHSKDKWKSGIYVIRNLINGKVYVGKAKCIYSRMMQHNTLLNRKHKDENRHLINAYHKYGKENFEYFVIEYLNFDENLLKEREIHWMKVFKSTDRNFGYNMREDTSTNMITKEETREKMRASQLERFKDPEERKKCSHDFWKKNPDKLKSMSKKVSKMNIKYKIEQYNKHTGEKIKVWDSILDLMAEHPEYKKHNIYAVCSGEKPSMYGYIWKKVLNNDIVRTV